MQRKFNDMENAYDIIVKYKKIGLRTAHSI